MKAIIVKNARVSFPSLFETEKFKGEDTGKYAITLILDKKLNRAAIDALKLRAQELAKEKFKGKMPKPSMVALKDGDDPNLNDGRPELKGAYYIKVSTRQPPYVFDARVQRITDPNKNPIYSGCYVNAKIDLWAQDNSYGKRINGTLIAVQFAADGETIRRTHHRRTSIRKGFAVIDDSSFFDEIPDTICDVSAIEEDWACIKAGANKKGEDEDDLYS